MKPRMDYFDYAHLPSDLQAVSKPFYQFAHMLDGQLADCDEKAVGMRKLLEAKDCMVRAALEERKQKERDKVLADLRK